MPRLNKHNIKSISKSKNSMRRRGKYGSKNSLKGRKGKSAKGMGNNIPIPRPRPITSLPKDISVLLIKHWVQKTNSNSSKSTDKSERDRDIHLSKIINQEKDRYNIYEKKIKPKIKSKKHIASLEKFSKNKNTSYTLELAMKAKNIDHYFELLGEAIEKEPLRMRTWEDIDAISYQVRVYNWIKQGIDERRKLYTQNMKYDSLLTKNQPIE